MSRAAGNPRTTWWASKIVISFFAFLIHQNFAVAVDVKPLNLPSECTPRDEGTPRNTLGTSRGDNLNPLLHSGTFSNQTLKPIDCEDLLQLGYKTSGVYNIWPKNKLLDGKVLQVYCDMETDGGGWTVLQRRGNFLRSTDYFYKDWVSYKNGFGNVEKDFWLGNDNIFILTNQRLYSVRFDLTDVESDHKYALYDVFFIDNEENKYKLTIQDYSGTANDSMVEGHNGQKFSTKDSDNDSYKDNCAVQFKGAWWYNACHTSNLNGLYLHGKHESFADGVNWKPWKGYHESLHKTEIKIRPKNFRTNLL